MKNNITTYKRVKINWLIFLILGGFHAWLIFAYILQWGNNPIDKTGLIVMSIIWGFTYILIGRFKVIIDDNLVIIKMDWYTFFKIPIAKIKSVNIERLKWAFLGGVYYGKNLERFHFDFVKQTVKIQMKSGKIYQIAIKNAEKIKEEIEKRINKTSVA